MGRVALSVGLGCWFLLPLVPLVLWAFADRWSFPDILPTRWGGTGVMAAIGQGAGPAFLTSLGLGCAVALVATPLGAMAAHAIAVHRIRGAGWLTVLLFAPIALPAFAVALGLNVILLQLHTPSVVGVVVVLVVYALPYTTFTMRAAYSAYDAGFEDEARLLGASRRQVVGRIHLPLIAPALARAAFLGFLVGWSDYLVTLLIGGGQLVSVPILVASSAAGTGNTSVTAVLSAAAILPPLVLLAVLEPRGRHRAAGAS
ncbi:MAG: ABC transporter permease subunit [Microbacteriaceae bacterium]|nr:MAG: ABC transporter permease subunit [Microbacteriaceae bacterium]